MNGQDSLQDQGQPIAITGAVDGVHLGGHVWRASAQTPLGSVIINPATGVLARYYHRYARFLARHGFDVLTYDYRGIGLSRPERLRHCGYRWRDWGQHDFQAALRFMLDHGRSDNRLVVGHSFGGALPGLAGDAARISRMLTVGAQFGWWGDYSRRKRARLFLRWHAAMPAITACCGYFPGRRLGWLEDLPSGVANEWSFGSRHFERRFSRSQRASVLAGLSNVTAPILAVTACDDPIGTPRAIRRTLGYYTRADRTAVLLRPADIGTASIGHFSLFHEKHAAGFWLDTLLWLRDGVNPWPASVIAVWPAERASHTIPSAFM